MAAHPTRLLLVPVLLFVSACAPSAPRDGQGAAADSLRAEPGEPPPPFDGRGALKIVQIYGDTRLDPGQAVSYRARLQPGFAAPVVFEWDFGDGTKALGNNVMHAFRQAGRYTVTVAARNAYNADTARLAVEIGSPAPPAAHPADGRPWAQPPALDGPSLYWVVGMHPSELDAAASADTLAAAGLVTTRLLLSRAEERYLLLAGGYATEREARRDRLRVERLSGHPAWLLRLDASILERQ